MATPRHGLGAAVVGDAIHVAGGGPIMGGGVQSAVHEASATRSELTPERVAAIREKILKGAYNSVDVVDQVARKMLASGDI